MDKGEGLIILSTTSIVALFLLSLFIAFPALTPTHELSTSKTHALQPSPPAATIAASVYTLGDSNSTKTCASIGGTWSNNTITCTLNTSFAIATGQTLVIEQNTTLLITSGVSYIVTNFGIYGTLDNQGTISAGNGVDLYVGGVLNNNGAINEYYNLYNGADGTVNNQGIFDSSGCNDANFGHINNWAKGVINFSAGYFANYGLMINNGTINNSGSGGACMLSGQPSGLLENARWLYNHGTINNYKGTDFANDYNVYDQAYGQTENLGGIINNYGFLDIDNYGGNFDESYSSGINNYQGTINNYGPGLIGLYNDGFLNNYASVNIGKGSFLLNDHSRLDNWIGTINIDGTLKNGRTINNYAIINNNGNYTNLQGGSGTITSWYHGALENQKGAVFNNNGNLTNNWDIGNWGTINNRGIIENNNASIYKDALGVFTNFGAGTVKNNTGTVKDCAVLLLLILTISHNGDYESNACAAVDYGLQANPSTVTLRPGSSASFRITVTSTSSVYVQNVTLAITTSPAGFKVVIAQDNISSFRSTFITISTSTSANPGNYTITITGTSGTLVRSVNLYVVIPTPPPPSFYLRSGADYCCPSVYSTPGSSTTITLTITPTNGWYGTANLTIDQPAELACKLNQTTVQVSPSGSDVTLVCNTNSVGIYKVTVSFTSGSVTWQLPVTVHVIPMSQPFFSPALAQVALYGSVFLAEVVLIIIILAISATRLRRKKASHIT